MPDLLDTEPPVVRGSDAPRVSIVAPKPHLAGSDRSPAIYHIPRAHLGDAAGWPEHFAGAAALGFNAVLLASPFAAATDPSSPRTPLPRDYGQIDDECGGGAAVAVLQQAAGAARQAGLELLLDIDISHIALDAPLLHQHADWFVHSGQGASFRFLGETDATVAWWDERIAAWQQAGIAGFRCFSPAVVPAAAWAQLIGAAQARDEAVVFIAWTAGLAPPDVAALREAGFGFTVSSSCWWDFSAGWLNDDTARVAAVAPPLALAGPPGELGWPLPQRRRAAGLAACFSAGWLLEAGFEAGMTDEVAALNRLRGQHVALGKAPPAQVISSGGNDIALLVRAGTPKLVLAVNASLAEPAAQPAASLLPAAGLTALTALQAAADVTPADTLALAPGEVGLFAAAGVPDVFLPVAIPLNLAAPCIAIEAITPQVDAGQFPVRRTVGEMVVVQADLIADGHDKLAGEILFRAADEPAFRAAPLSLVSNDRWTASFPLERMGRYVFQVVAWKDVYATFVDEVTKKHAAGVPIKLELQEGLTLVQETANAAAPEEKAKLMSVLRQLQNADEATKLAAVVSPEMVALMRAADLRRFETRSSHVAVDAERLGASFASWYEVFPRSQSGDESQHGTFIDVIGQLPRIAEMGFDVLYFPPIHPIGRTNRKGRNNTLTPGPDDPGSPYAIGAAEGGHTALHPELGSFADFQKLREAAKGFGIELAIDFAIQCAPDHPWLKEHPEWFDWRPDGSLRYAENPPKKYEDIVNVDFYAAGAKPSLWLALRDAVQFWADQGVRLFRVDNPHTKPLPFWEWMIADIRSRHPDAVFLAEAFTRPKVMYRLAKIGFSQSYTYFTWRNTKAELEEYLTELNEEAPKDFFKPHFFVNTPDINPVFLHTSGRGGFLIRAALAATLSGLWGVYNGFELCEATPVAPGKEEYRDSEKYQLKAWDYDRPGNIVAEITRLNRIRRGNAALRSHLGVTFLTASNEQVLYFMKRAADGNTLLVAISLDPKAVQEATIELPLFELGLEDDGALQAEDLMRDFGFTWYGKYQNVRLNPAEQPFCIWRIKPLAV